MALSSAVVKTGASAMTPTGGSDKTFTPDGQTVPNGIHIADAAQADFRIRDNMSLKSKVPTLQGDGSYSKGKRSVTIVMPRLLASGMTVFNLVRLEVEVHPEMTAALELDLRMVAAQVLSDSDFSSFWTAGSLA